MTGSSDSEVKPPLPEQAQEVPGYTDQMDPRPDHGEESSRGSGRREGMAAIITGGDSGIGRAVAIAYAREGADVLIAYLSEHEDAKDTARWVETAGRRAVLMAGDVGREAFCREIAARAMEEFGRIDIVVNNAAHQQTIADISELTEAEIDLTFRTNIYSHFFLCKAALPH
ncbi:MAG TPA: SDR family NAD(P)-dependent oxidoreductase, partial [Rhizobiaceae bacterium]|nr:SDR family NAD(P)-dependent oxidoreductase [Rhizobiaceae bacterium]